MRVAVYLNSGKMAVPAAAAEVARCLRGMCAEVVYDDVSAECVGERGAGRLERVLGGVDAVMVLGGDGTMLSLVHALGDVAPLLCGVNLGTLGFLAGFGANDLAAAAAAVVGGGYRVSERALVRLRVIRDGVARFDGTALNEVVVFRGDHSRVIRLELSIGGHVVSEYTADGLIISTPTGSTAYSMSAGGPILSPEAAVMVVTPICPHVLMSRSLVVEDRREILIRPLVQEAGMAVALDGREPLMLGEGDLLVVSRAERTLRLAFPRESDFYGRLRSKLGWSGSVV
jgi:NAD+ kinase